MTEQQTDPVLQPVRIGGAASGRDTTLDRFPFYLGATDETVLIGTRPPIATLLRLVSVMQDEGNVMAMAAAYNEFLDEVLDEPSAAYLRKRMEDKDDELDLDHPDLHEMFKHLVAVWYGGGGPGRPTGGRGASSPPSSTTGKRSTARSRSKASTPKTGA